MYMDAQNRPSNAQSVISGIATVVSTDSIDMLSQHDNIGRSGIPLRAWAGVVTTIVGPGSSIQAQLIESDNSNLSSPTVLASGPVVGVAAGAAGAELLDVPVPDTSKRYLGFQFVIAGAAITAGAVTAGIVGGTDRPATTIPMNTGL